MLRITGTEERCSLQRFFAMPAENLNSFDLRGSDLPKYETA